MEAFRLRVRRVETWGEWEEREKACEEMEGEVVSEKEARGEDGKRKRRERTSW